MGKRVNDQSRLVINLTKREFFAVMIIQGYCSGKIGEMGYDKVAEIAVKQAEALISVLESNDDKL